MKQNDTLTVKVTIVDKDKAKWLWDSHGKNIEINGVLVTALEWGDVFADRDKYLEEIEEQDIEEFEDGRDELDLI